MSIKLLLVALAMMASPVFAQSHSHTSPGLYAGQQGREIKALEPRDIDALRQGAGMGFAKAAELNGFPGPMHTLELASALRLGAEQRASTRALMDEHKARARAIGLELIAAEARLDQLFRSSAATEASVREATLQIAHLQGQLRADHLVTHLKQAALLSEAQREEYARQRGYLSEDRPASSSGER